MMEKEFYSMKEVAELFGVNLMTVWGWRDRGILNAFKVGPHLVRFKRADVYEMLQKQNLPMKDKK